MVNQNTFIDFDDELINDPSLDDNMFLRGNFDVSGTILRLKGIFTPSVLARRSYFYLQGLMSSIFTGNHFTRRSGIETYLMAFTFDGEGALEYEGKHYTLKSGEGFIIDCRRPHYYHASTRKGWGYHIIHFDGFAMSDYFSQIRQGGGIQFSVPQEGALASMLEKLYQINIPINQRSELLSSCVLTNMLTEIITGTPDCDTEDIPEKIKDIRAYINEHYAEEFDLEDLSRRFFMSKYHLCREFKKYIGRSPNEYRIITRINNAKAMLHFTDMRVADIAREVGFADNTHFFSIFRKYEQMSPAEYRRQWTGKSITGSNPIK
ncbi:MAG: AraC family transcriptional regulator [Treponema sp.]|nr:AraC family transcriptional regulator [Treponema sp.]